MCDGNWQLRSMDRTPSLETSEHNLRVWKKRACNHGQIRIDEDELGAHDFGLTAADTLSCRSHKGCIGRITRLDLGDVEIEQ